ncbi:Dabb family protein [Janthinobacterium fluminis]|uniref:Dabb family protein n=1 Tax=Janthinobacterium fluminis TaxID=2987524 RepID=A0ABT5JTT8_9BURK|nr:Dabb family protein [Janthinobacterium fluminis]MDC8755984.1 Dabb family protein [Janthinobacterium fluminis]
MDFPHGLRHLVLCTFRTDISDEQYALLVREFARLKEAIPVVRHFEHGLNNSPEGLADGYTDCFTLLFDGVAGRDAYLLDPAHLRFVELLKPWLAKVLVVDYVPGPVV